MSTRTKSNTLPSSGENFVDNALRNAAGRPLLDGTIEYEARVYMNGNARNRLADSGIYCRDTGNGLIYNFSVGDISYTIIPERTAPYAIVRACDERIPAAAAAADTPSDTPSGAPAPVAINTVVDLPLESIAPSFGNDRTTFDESALQELAESIRTNGLAQPITVRPVADGKYQLIAGERRFRAHKLIGAPTIRAIVTPMDDNQAAAVMLVENTGRKDLDPIDEARAYARRRDEFKWDEKTIAERAGVGIQTVRNRLALLQLRPDLQDLVKTGTLPIGYAIVIATAGLDNNRQLIALKDLNANPAPSVAWLRGRCSELGQAQAQSDMFDSVLFSAAEFAGVTRKAEFEQRLPADPRKDKAPQDGDTYRAILENQIAFWKAAAAGWDGYGKAAPRDRCLAAMSALQSIVDLMPAHNANGKRYTQKGRDYIVYQAAV